MTYEAMSDDLLGFLKNIKENDIDLLGHSMGGKIAMIFALSNVSTHMIIKNFEGKQISVVLRLTMRMGPFPVMYFSPSTCQDW